MIEKFIKEAFLEDIPAGDVTTDSLGIKEKYGIAQLIAKQDLVLSGKDLFTQCLSFIDPQLELKWFFEDGQKVLNKQSVCQIHGNLTNLIKAERVALNFLGYLSGIATQTSFFAKACQGTTTRILDTRKTLPLYRHWSKKAVVDGGGCNHRLNLSDKILIKENHINISGSIESCLAKVKAHSSLEIEIEVKSLSEIKEAVRLGVNRIMLDNMSLNEMKEGLELIPKDIETEASGNMTLDRIASVAQLGIDFISVGALTHSVKNADFSLLFDWEE